MSRIERIMLINPPVRHPSFADKITCQPMGLAYLAAVLRTDYEVKILDTQALGRDQERWFMWNFIEYGMPHEETVKEIEKFSPQVVGISCLFSSQLPIVMELTKKIKESFPSIITVTGGTHPSFLPEDSLGRAPALDYIMIGESEQSFPELLRLLAAGKSPETVDGVAWRENGKVRVNPKTRWIEDLDSIPFPAYDLLPMEKYFEINVPFMYYSKSPRNTSFLTSRGCPFKCAFCSSCHYWGNKVRYRSIENVLAELRMLKAEFGIEEVKFEEDNLLLNRERAKKLFRGMIAEKMNLHWNMPNGAYIMSLLDEELVKLMKESGCFEVTLAFESGDQEVLDNIIHKPLDLSRAGEAVKNLRGHDIDIHAYFIIGFPGETRQQIKNSFRLANKYRLDKPYFFAFTPLPGSELYAECVAKGIYDPEKTFTANYAIGSITTDQFNPQLIRRWQYSYAILQNFYLLFWNPRILFGKYLKRVLNRRNFGAIPRAIRTFTLNFFRK